MRSVRNGTILSEDHVVTLAYNMLCGLNFVHQMGLIHRDLKPANILIGDCCSVKFCDFGLSCWNPLNDKCVTHKLSKKIQNEFTA